MKQVENDFDLQTGKLRDQTVNELMKQVDAAMEEKDLDQASTSRIGEGFRQVETQALRHQSTADPHS